MQIVMKFTSVDSLSWTPPNVLPIESESLETAAAELIKLATEAYPCEFEFCGHCLFSSDFIIEGKFNSPDFLTVNEWFSGK